MPLAGFPEGSLLECPERAHPLHQVDENHRCWLPNVAHSLTGSGHALLMSTKLGNDRQPGSSYRERKADFHRSAFFVYGNRGMQCELACDFYLHLGLHSQESCHGTSSHGQL